jgi:hypothetical protein
MVCEAGEILSRRAGYSFREWSERNSQGTCANTPHQSAPPTCAPNPARCAAHCLNGSCLAPRISDSPSPPGALLIKAAISGSDRATLRAVRARGLWIGWGAAASQLRRGRLFVLGSEERL